MAVIHDRTTRQVWMALRLKEFRNEPQPNAYILLERFVHVLRTLMLKEDAVDDVPEKRLKTFSIK